MLGPTVPLNSPCDGDDLCADANARCIGGLCRCQPLFYEDSNICSQSHHYYAIKTTLRAGFPPQINLPLTLMGDTFFCGGKTGP